MKFFFPDSQDLVDPSFDFRTETRSDTRVRQRDDQYPHEVFATPPYDGMLVSKAIVDVVSASTYVGEIVTCASARPGTRSAAPALSAAIHAAVVRAR